MPRAPPSLRKKPRYSPSPESPNASPIAPSHSNIVDSTTVSNPDSSFGEVFLKDSSNNPNSNSQSPGAASVDTIQLDDSMITSMSPYNDSIAALSPVATEASQNTTTDTSISSPNATSTSLLPPSSNASSTPPAPVTASAIETKMTDLFSDIPIGCPLTTTSCSSSRVFASALLLNPSLSCLKPLMEAFVDAELCVLSSLESTTSSSTPSHSPAAPTTRLTFCAYDFSSVSPPVDVEVGSNGHLEKCVIKIAKIVERLNDLAYLDALDPRRTALTSLIEFVGKLSERYDPEGQQLRSALNETMPESANWLPARFLGAGRFYKKEMVVAYEMACDADREFGPGVLPSPLRLRLGELIGACCRYHLRRLFNPVPPSYTKPKDGKPIADYSCCRSKIHELVCMDMPGDAAADGSISSVLNGAVKHVWEERLARDEIEISRVPPSAIMEKGSGATATATANNLDASFVVSAVSMKGLEGGTLSDDDLELVMQDIELAHVALAGSRAAKFILELLNWGGVGEAIEASGGWECIETYASLITSVKLTNIAVDEAHFALFHNMKSLVSELTVSLETSEQR